MTVNATELLEKIGKENEDKLKSITVEKAIDLDIDVGSLLAIDNNLLDDQALKSNKESYMLSLARDNAQLLFNEVWKLPSEKMQDATVAQLPAPTTSLPREKHIPKPKPLTKWEEFAKLKGIKKKKTGSKMVWDDESKSWKPRWGYKRAGDKTKEWVLEVPANADPNEDQFEKEIKAKKERVAKNELQRLRNIARRSGKKVPGIGETMTPDGNKSIPQLKKSFELARQSTASMGRFDDKLGEKPAKNQGKKRKFEALGYSSKEKQKQLGLLTKMYKNKQALDVNRAVNLEMGRSGGEVKKTKVQKGKSARKGGSKTPARKRGKK